MYAKVYDLDEHLEITMLPFKPEGKKDVDRGGQLKSKLRTLRLLKAEEPNLTKEESLNRLQPTKDTQEENRARVARRRKTMIRRYIKRYKMNYMYTFTFAENMALSKKAETCGEWRKRYYRGKMRQYFHWTKKAEGERIENNIYYDRQGNTYDLKERETAWLIWEKYIKKHQKENTNFQYLVVPELQKRGVVHFHVATNQCADNISSFWKYGFVGSPKQISNTTSAYKYITKYITKDSGDDSGHSDGRKGFRRSLCLTIPTKQIKYESNDVADFLDAIIDTYLSNGFVTEYMRLYISKRSFGGHECTIITCHTGRNTKGGGTTL